MARRLVAGSLCPREVNQNLGRVMVKKTEGDVWVKPRAEICQSSSAAIRLLKMMLR